MQAFFDIDWKSIFYPEVPVLELFLRGSLIYLGLFLLLRFVLKRESGVVAITDLLVVVLIADAAQNAMADGYRSIPDGFLLIGTIVFWSYALNWLGYKYPALQRFVHPMPLLLVKNGKIMYRNMRRELITKEELMSMIREQGLDDLSEVKEAYMEGDGRISVIPMDHEPQGAPERRIL